MIHLIVGNTGSGKTTYSAKLKKRITELFFLLINGIKRYFLLIKNQPTD